MTSPLIWLVDKSFGPISTDLRGGQTDLHLKVVHNQKITIHPVFKNIRNAVLKVRLMDPDNRILFPFQPVFKRFHGFERADMHIHRTQK